MIFYYSYNTIIGKLCIAEKDGCIGNLFFNGCIPEEGSEYETTLVKETFLQLSEYFDGKRKSFDIPVNPEGSGFHKKVWDKLMTVPYGETRTYRELAGYVDSPKASRAVGLANNKNPVPIIIPCHRIIGSNGKLVGYAGGLEIKKFLLNLENNNTVRNDRLF